MHVEVVGASMGGASWVRAVSSFRAKRTVGGGLEWGWDWLCVHKEATGANKGGQAGCVVWALSGPRGLCEGGWDGIGIGCVCT